MQPIRKMLLTRGPRPKRPNDVRIYKNRFCVLLAAALTPVINSAF